MLSKTMQCVVAIAAVALGGAGAIDLSDAATLPARVGKSDHPVAEPGCWQPNGPSVTNICGSAKLLWFPVPNAGGSFWITMTAQAPSAASNVRCHAMTSDWVGGSFSSPSGWVGLPAFGPPQNLNMMVSVPFGGGTAMVDCEAQNGGKLHTMAW